MSPRRRSFEASALSFVLLVALSSCASLGCGGQAPAKDPASSEGSSGAEDARKRALEAAKVRPELLRATVYDALGQALVCAAPKPAEQCGGAESDTDLKDRCKSAGFNVRRCGCDLLCAGNVAASKAASFYDVTGAPRACAKEEADCSPPAPSTAFQDACNDKGFRLQICGCEWLCSGKPRTE